jgi:hypothetical protein
VPHLATGVASKEHMLPVFHEMIAATADNILHNVLAQ